MSIKKPVLYLYHCLARTSILCGSKEATSSCRVEWSVCSRKVKDRCDDQGQYVWGTNVAAGVVLNINKTRELGTEDINSFQNFLRMHPKLFDEFLERISQPLFQH